MLSTLITTFFGSGMSPKAPGTMGSLAATIAAYPMALVAGNFLGETVWFRLFFLFAALVVFFGAIPFVNKAMKDTATEDPGWIVIDEVCGIFMTFAFINPVLISNMGIVFTVPPAAYRFWIVPFLRYSKATRHSPFRKVPRRLGCYGR